MQQLYQTTNFDVILDRFVDEFISACPPPLRGQIAQIDGLENLTVDSVVRARTDVIHRLRVNDDSVSLDCYGRSITFPAQASEAVRFALTQSEFAIRELPGNLDDASKVVLVRRLIREGLLMAINTSPPDKCT